MTSRQEQLRKNSESVCALRRRRLLAGVCVLCATPSPKTLCPACAERKRAWKKGDTGRIRTARGAYREAGLCTECGADRSAGYVTCVDCREKRTTVAFRQRAAARQRRINTGVTAEQYAALLKTQDSRCAICGVAAPDAPRKTLCADHDHATGMPRGLLCIRCNSGLGLLRDDEHLLSKAIDYLRSHRMLRVVGG